MWQVAYRMSLFSPRGGRYDNYDWTVPSKYLSHPIGLTLNQMTRTSRHSLPVKNQLNHEALEKLICHDCSMGLSDKARQGGITLANPNQRGCSRSITVLSAEEVYYLWARTALGMRGCMVPIAELAVIPLGWLMRSLAQCLMCLIWAADEAVTLTEPTRLPDWWSHLRLSLSLSQLQ